VNRFRLGKPALHQRSTGTHPASLLQVQSASSCPLHGAWSLLLLGRIGVVSPCKLFFGCDFEPTFILYTLFLMHLNCSVPLVLLRVVSSDQKAKIFISHKFKQKLPTFSNNILRSHFKGKLQVSMVSYFEWAGHKKSVFLGYFFTASQWLVVLRSPRN